RRDEELPAARRAERDEDLRIEHRDLRHLRALLDAHALRSAHPGDAAARRRPQPAEPGDHAAHPVLQRDPPAGRAQQSLASAGLIAAVATMNARERPIAIRDVAPALLLCGLALLLLAGLPWPCPLKLVTGLPCPTCGMTRAARAALHGDFAT